MNAVFDQGKPAHYLWFQPMPGKAHQHRVICTCGWKYFHRRARVQQRAAEKHIRVYGAVFAQPDRRPA